MAYNILAAKRAGATDEQIARIIAEDLGKNYEALLSQGVTPDQIIKIGTEEEDLSFGEAFSRGFRAEVGSEIRGLRQLAGGELTAEEVEQENLARLAEEQRGVATTLGRFTGGLVNPSTLIPGSLLFKGAKGVALGGAVAGGVSGAVDPVFVEEEDPSRLTKAAIGTVGGAVLGGTLGLGVEALQRRAGRTIDDVAKVEPDATADAPKTREQIEAELPPLTPTENTLPALLAKAPEADQKYVESVLSRYDLDEEVPYPVIKELSDKVEDKELAALFKGLSDPPATKAEEFVPENKLPEVTAKVEPDQGVAKSTDLDSLLSKAQTTGDYRDYLTQSAVRFNNISPVQFQRMIDPANPFKDQNVKVLISKDQDDVEVLSQIYGALQGRFKYERQTGKTFKEITEQGQTIPEEFAVEAFLNRKLEETLPAPVLASALRAASKAINDLHNARDLARVAREMGSDEAYAVLQQEMARAAGLLASIEGNSSNLGRSLAYLKEAKKLIAQNKPLRPYLGGIRC